VLWLKEENSRRGGNNLMAKVTIILSADEIKELKRYDDLDEFLEEDQGADLVIQLKEELEKIQKGEA